MGLIYGNINTPTEKEILDKIFNCPDVRRHFEVAGVIDLWFEPVYESKELYFGKIKFTIHKGYADTEYGKVTKESLREIFNYITSVPTLSGWNLMLKMPNMNHDIIKFGTHEGTLGDLISIYEAM